jgi:hypothetical protein
MMAAATRRRERARRRGQYRGAPNPAVMGTKREVVG